MHPHSSLRPLVSAHGIPYIRFYVTASVLVYKLGAVMGLPRSRISRHAKKNYSPSTWVRLKTELRGPLCGKLDIYPTLVQHLLLSRILLIRNTVQNQERGRSPLGSKSPHNKDLALMLDAHDTPWLPTQSLLSFLPTIHSTSVVMGASLTAH